MAVEQADTALALLDGELSARASSRRTTRDSALRRMLAAADVVAVLSVLLVAELIRPGADLPKELLWGLAAIPLMLVLFKVYGLYDRDAKRISHSTVDDLPWLFHATVIGGLLLWLYARYSPMYQLDFAQVLVFGVGMVGIVSALRFSVRAAAGLVIGQERALLVGGGEMARTLVRKLAAHPEYGVEVIGSLAPQRESIPDAQAEVPMLGTLADLDKVANQHRVNRVFFPAGEADDAELELLLRRCRALALRVSILPKLSDVLGPSVTADDVEGITVFGINPPWLPRSSRALKRAMDFVIASLLLILLAPVLALIVLAIKLDSRGPAFFVQTRVGRDGRRFRLLKFRTMVVDAEQRRAELVIRSADPHWLNIDHDPRVTRIGRRLRRLSLDELPQLLNVLRGQMSMVGPRPLIEVEDERVEGWARGRLNLTPGITGYWQVLGRTRIPFEEMVKLDYLYVMNWSLWEDVRLMLRTLPVVLGGKGAN